MAFSDFVRRLQGSTVRFDLSRYQSELAGIGDLERDCRRIIGRRNPATSTRPTRACRRRSRFSRPPPIGIRSPARPPGVRSTSDHSTNRCWRRLLWTTVTSSRCRPARKDTGGGDAGGPQRARWPRCSALLTFNDYLARRDAEWMGPVYPATRHRRRIRPARTHTRGTTTGLSHRHHLCDRERSRVRSPSRPPPVADMGNVVHRPFHCTIVDEADSLMIDEARAARHCRRGRSG